MSGKERSGLLLDSENSFLFAVKVSCVAGSSSVHCANSLSLPEFLHWPMGRVLVFGFDFYYFITEADESCDLVCTVQCVLQMKILNFLK